MQVRKNVLTLSIIAALGISGAALAQETQSSDPAKELDAVVVIDPVVAVHTMSNPLTWAFAQPVGSAGVWPGVNATVCVGAGMPKPTHVIDPVRVASAVVLGGTGADGKPPNFTSSLTK